MRRAHKLHCKRHIVTETTQARRNGQNQRSNETEQNSELRWKTPLKVATWSVRSLIRKGAESEVDESLSKYGVSIAGLQEGSGMMELEHGKVYYSGRKDTRHIEGVGIYVAKNLSQNVM